MASLTDGEILFLALASLVLIGSAFAAAAIEYQIKNDIEEHDNYVKMQPYMYGGVGFGVLLFVIFLFYRYQNKIYRFFHTSKNRYGYTTQKKSI